MFNHLKNDKGIALIMVIIMLVIVGGLSAALLISSRGHVRTSIHEQTMAQAFHSAEAGVEIARANSNKIFSETSGKTVNEENGEFIKIDSDNVNIVDDGAKWHEFSDSEINFNLKIVANDDNKITLLSEGRYEFDNEIIKRIKFDLSKSEIEFTGFNEVFNIKKDDDIDEMEDHYNLSGPPGGYNINIPGYDEEGNYFEEENYWSDIETWEDFWQSYVHESHFTIREEYDLSYAGGDIVNQEIIYVGGDLSISGNSEIYDSIFVVDGNISTGHGTPHIKDSVIIVKDYVDIGGTPHFDDSLVLIYGEDSFPGNDKIFLDDSGWIATGVNFPKDGNDFGGDFPPIVSIENWEQQ